MTDSYHYAERIVKKLTTAGYIAYFAGGWVRDLLLGHPSSDIDIATDAPPQVILDLFERTTHVGLHFGVVIVAAGGHQYEVATFRKDVSYSNGRKPDRVEMSTPEEDACRRDFTINGMFFDPATEQIYDYVGGMADLRQGLIRAIGDPYERFWEDRLRMLRAIRFATRLGFVIEAGTQEAIAATSEILLPAVAMERIWQELGKMANAPAFDSAVITMHRLGLLPVIFPTLKGAHLNDIKHQVSHFAAFPSEVPPVLAFAQLFPTASQEELIDIFSPLKISKAEQRWLIAWAEWKKLLGCKEVSRASWGRCYADPHSDFCLAVAAALQGEKKESFMAQHIARKEILAPHIRRLQEKKPLVTAEHLASLGIKPGKKMGELLKKAENLAIEEDFASADELILALNVKSYVDS